MEDFRAIYRAIVHRHEFQELFSAYAPNSKVLANTELIAFLKKEQHETEACETTALEIILKYEPIEEVRARRQLSFEGFIRYMSSEDSSIFKKSHRTIYQDMNHPLCDYFISSSHNTYLISNQLVGPSDLWGYISALLKGCRCLEIDCWDGSNNEPVVYHGHTLTSKIPFNSVIQVIDKYAFLASDYPVILSLENHCSPKQQEIMAEYLKNILGEKLLTSTIGDTSGGTVVTQLPSPEELKFKILVKNKKIGTIEESMLRRETDNRGETVEISDSDHTSDEEEVDDTAPLHSNKERPKRKGEQRASGPPRKKAKMKKIQIALMLSDLVIYTKSAKFVSFEHSLANQKCYENNSIGETRAQKFVKHSAKEFVSHTTRFITRIYPKGTRTSSSNYNPQPFWNVGCQMGNFTKQWKLHLKDMGFQWLCVAGVAGDVGTAINTGVKISQIMMYFCKEVLKCSWSGEYPGTAGSIWKSPVTVQMQLALNFQTPGVQMELQHGKFLDNGGCGYVLKPEFLRNQNSTFTPQDVGIYSKPMSLSIKLISGHQLPPSNLSKTNKADPLVQIEIYGVPEDQVRKKSSVVKSNALSPRWNESFSFSIQVPELALIRFCVKDEISLVSNEFLGQYTLPVLSLNKGYRHVPLLSKDGDNLEPASLFIHVWYY